MTFNITLIGINYYPEDSSTGLYTTQMAEHLQKVGNNIEIIAGFPYYPQWQIRKEYQHIRKFMQEQHHGINIFRYKQYTPSNPSFKKRILHLIDFTFGSFCNLFKIKKCDLVIAIVPFTSTALLAIILAKLKGAKIWVHIQDFEFDAAHESGLGKGKIFNLVFKLLLKMESWMLNRADLVSTISHNMMNKLKNKTKTENYFFPNWIDPNMINPTEFKQHKFLTSDKFKILYSGNIGDKQDWEFFFKVADHLKNNDDIEFIIVGSGSKKQKLLELISDLKNVFYHEPVVLEELSDLLCSANLHILFQKNNIIDTVMPSKILAMMSSAKPSIITGNRLSELTEIFAKSNGGYFINSDDFEGVIEKINYLKNNADIAYNMGLSARQFIIKEFDKEKIMMNLEKKITELLSK